MRNPIAGSSAAVVSGFQTTGLRACYRNIFHRHRLAARRLLTGVMLLPMLLSLNGCGMVLFNPKGDIGAQEKNLILLALGLMLLVVIPVIILTLYFGWHYRASNTRATYAPKWAHSTKIEVVVWTIPCIIVGFLAVLIWGSTHSLDPYQPIKSDVAPVRVQVVALNWKWLFIYPDYGIATVNKLAIPVDTPVDFKLTAESLMNSFFIPQLGSQVYAMAGMQTQLHLIANSPGVYDGLSSAYSGAGFSDMHFDTVATSRADFDAWIRQTKASPLTLTQAAYQTLAQPSSKNPVTLYAGVDPDLFEGIVNHYMKMPKAMDMSTPKAMQMDMPMSGAAQPAQEAKAPASKDSSAQEPAAISMGDMAMQRGAMQQTAMPHTAEKSTE